VIGVEVFGASRACFEDVVDWLAGAEAASLDHGPLEDDLERRGREVVRRLLQDHFDLRASQEKRVKVTACNGVTHGSVEAEHTRVLTTVFGTVSVERLAYRHRGAENLHPADAALNLPTERHSHGLRRLAAVESTRGSYDAAAEAISRATGVAVAKRQVEKLARSAAVDVGDFYATSVPEPGASDDVLVVSVDGKGIVMRPDSLRPATEKAAAAATNKLKSRLSKGEKRDRKRMAEVGAVYDLAPVPRTPADVLASKSDAAARPAPRAKAKWVTASVADDAAEVISRGSTWTKNDTESTNPATRTRPSHSLRNHSWSAAPL